MRADHLLPETIGAVVDGELSQSDEPAVYAHLNQCHVCALNVIAAGRMKSATARAAQRTAPSADEFARLTKLAQQNPPRRAQVVSMRPIAWGAAAALLFVALLLGGTRIIRQSDALSAEILDQHLATLSQAALPQVISTDRHTVKPWFEGKLPFSFNIPEQSELPPDSALLGADLAYVNEKPAALLLFTIHKHHISVFVSQAGELPELARLKDQSGFHFSTAKASGLELLGVSDVDGAELDALLQKLATAQ